MYIPDYKPTHNLQFNTHTHTLYQHIKKLDTYIQTHTEEKYIYIYIYIYIHTYKKNFPINLNIKAPNRSVKNVNH